jgi:hypothetical protein
MLMASPSSLHHRAACGSYHWNDVLHCKDIWRAEGGTCRLPRMQGTSLAKELAKFTPYAAMCAVRSLVALLDPRILCCQLPLPCPSDTSSAAASPDALAHDAPWTLLMDGAIPHCMQLVASMTDSHTKLAALSALAASLHRITELTAAPGTITATCPPSQGTSPTHDNTHGKVGTRAAVTSSWAAMETTFKDALVVPHALALRIVNLVLDNLDDCLKLIPAAAVQAFATLCSILARQPSPLSALATTADPTANLSASSPVATTVLPQVAAFLLSLPTTKKARFALLHILVPHVGAQWLLEKHPSLIAECMCAMHDDTASASSDLFSVLLATLLSELAPPSCTAAASPPATVLESFRRYWVRHVVAALCAADTVLRARVATYCIPALFKTDPACLPVLLHVFSPPCATAEAAEAPRWGLSAPVDISHSVAATVLLLRTAKKMGLFDMLSEVVALDGVEAVDGVAAGGAHKVPFWVLQAAASHHDEVLRLQVLELAAVHSKTSSVRHFTQNIFRVARDQVSLCAELGASAAYMWWLQA